MLSNKRLSNFLVVFWIMVLVIVGLVPSVAQDDGSTAQNYEMIDNPDPVADAIFGETEETSLEAVTANTDDFYGDVITLEGEIGEFINLRSFALGESAALDNDLVLVLNNSNTHFDPEIVTEARVRVTGRVYPSITAVEEGAQTNFGAIFDEADENMYEPESDAASRVDMLQFYYDGWLPQGFNNYTVLEILNVENVEFIELTQNEVGN